MNFKDISRITVMERTLLTTVQDIVYLLNMNGNTKEYQTKVKLLPNDEMQVLKTMKLRQAQHQHRTKNMNQPKVRACTIKTPPLASLAVDVATVDVWEGFLNEVRRNESESRYKLIEWLVNDVKKKTSSLDEEPCNEKMGDEVATALSKLDKATQCLSPINETLMTWRSHIN